MRNPLNKAAWSFVLSAVGACLLLLAVVLYDRVGQLVSTIVGIVGMAMAVIFLFTLAWALLSAVGYARLMSGKGVIARWHVSAQDWDRFRAFDKSRATEHVALRNDMRVRDETPPGGVDVIVGRGSLIVDGSYHSIGGLASGGRQVNWINAPVDPECIEFPKSYPRSKGGSLDLTLRVPVPRSAREEGVRVFEFFRPQKG